MKTQHTFHPILAAALAAGSLALLPLYAEEAAEPAAPVVRERPARPPREVPPEQREIMLKRFDADGDGVLSPEERLKARETMQAEHQAQLFKKLDTDGDGVLTLEEFARGRELARERIQRDRPLRPGGDGELRPPRRGPDAAGPGVRRGPLPHPKAPDAAE